MTFTVEDALISPMGLAVLSGAGLINHDKSECAHVHATIEKVIGEDAGQPIVTVDLDDLRDETGFTTATGFDVCRKIPAYATVIGASGKAEDFLELSVLPKPEEGQTEPETFKVTEDTPVVFSVESSNPVVGKTVVLDFYLIMTNNAQTITIGPEDFGGYYYVEAQTLFRDEGTGKDMAANITFPKIKIQSAFTFTMAASGDPSTFTFTMDAFPGYTITKRNKKTLCDIQILSLESSSDDVSYCDDGNHDDIDSPDFQNSLSVAVSKLEGADLNPGMPGLEIAKENQKITKVAKSGRTFTISEEAGKQWESYESSNPAQGTHEWVGLVVDTGEDDITKVTFNGQLLTAEDVAEAASVNAGAGKFILWVKADDSVHYPRTIKLGTEGKQETDIVINIING